MNQRAGIAALSLLLLSMLPNVAAGEGKITEFYVAPTFTSFTWKESNSSGGRLVKESGPLYGLRSGIRAVPVQGEGGDLTLSGVLELFGGVVRYDGEQNLTNLPVSTDVDYFGTRLGFDAGWGLPLYGSTLGPFAGFTYRFWVRSLNDASTVDSNGNRVPVSGTTEYWNDLGTRLGGRWSDIGIVAGGKLFLEGGAQYSLYTGTTFDTGYGTSTLEPRGIVSPFAEAGLRFQRLRIALTYEEKRYGVSPSIIAGQYKYYQPASVGEYLGLSVGYCFR